jgi:hypothetical protein
MLMNTPTRKVRLFSSTTVSLASAFAVLLLPVVVLADDCAYQETLSFSLPAAQVQKLDITAGAGTLEVLGDSADGQIHVQALVCASRKSQLEGAGVEHALRSSTQFIETRIPENQTTFWTSNYVRIDLTVHLPAGMPVQIKDGSGSLSVSGTGALVLRDGSGTAAIDSVAGNLEVRDGSGDLNIANVTGNVDVSDGSGSLSIIKVDGNVDITDGSGSIDVRDVTREVTIHESGSGSVALQRVNTVTQVAAE